MAPEACRLEKEDLKDVTRMKKFGPGETASPFAQALDLAKGPVVSRPLRPTGPLTRDVLNL